MRNELAHVGITVSSIERTADFYTTHLGFTGPKATFPYSTPWIGTMVGHPGTKLNLAFMALGDLVIEMHEYDHPSGLKAMPADTTLVGCVHIAIAVADIDATYSRMRADGVDFISPPQEVTDGRFQGFIGAYCRDPDGYIIELNQAPASSPDISELTVVTEHD